MNKTLKQVLQIIFFFAIGFGILYYLYQSQNEAYQAQCLLEGTAPEDCSLINKILNDFSNVNFSWLVLILGAFMMSNYSRAKRWQLLLEPVAKRPSIINSFFAIMLGYLANLGFPRIGEIVRSGVLARYEDIEMEKVVGTVMLDRILDLISFFIVFALMLLFEFDNISKAFGANFEFNTTTFLTQIGVMLGGLVLAFFVLRYILNLTSENKIILKIQTILRGFLDGLSAIRKVKNMPALIFHSVMIWLMYYLMNYFGLKVFPITAHLGFQAALTLFVFGALGFIIPSPGGMGTYHYFITEALKIYGIDSIDAFSFANIIYFAIQIGCNVGFGLLGLLILPIYNANRTSAETNNMQSS